MRNDNAELFGYGTPLSTTSGYDDTYSFNTSFVTNSATSPVLVKQSETGKSIYITDIVVSASAANRVDFQDGDGTLVLPLRLGATAPVVIRLTTPKKLTAAKNLMVKSATGVELAVSVDGYLK